MKTEIKYDSQEKFALMSIFNKNVIFFRPYSIRSLAVICSVVSFDLHEFSYFFLSTCIVFKLH